MKTLLSILFFILFGCLFAYGIAYLMYATDTKQDAKSFQKIRFRDLERMYTIAPEKWSAPDYDFETDYVYYKESEDARKTRIYMTSFLGTVRLRYELKSGRRKFSKQIYMEDRAKLLKAFQKDINKYIEDLEDIHSHYKWRKADFHVGDVVQTVNGLDRGLVTDVNENNLPTKVMSSPGGVSYNEIRYYGGVDSEVWYKTGERMTTKEWYELYSTKEGWQRYCEDRQNQIKLGE